MAYTGYRSLKKTQPDINKLVEVAHIISGAGAPERKGWFSQGRLRESGRWSIKQNPSGTVDFREPTHWREMQE